VAAAGADGARVGVGVGREAGVLALALVAITSITTNAAGSERITAIDFLRSTVNIKS